MRILFDGRVLEGTSSGVRDVAAGLVRGLRQLEADGRLRLLIGSPSSDERIDVQIPSRGFMEVGLPLAAILRRADRILVPRQTVPLLSPVPAVPVFHDIGFLQRPELYPEAKRIAMTTRIAARRSRGLAVSRYTASEMTERGMGKSIIPLPIGAVHRLTWSPDQNNRYILCVAAQEPHKNIPRLLKAWQIADTEGVRLVICGRRGRDSRTIDQVLANLPKRASVDMVGGLDDLEYAMLMEQCWGYVQPSFYEGLCIPALDLAAAGAPMIVSSESNLGRVFSSGPGAQSFDPASISGLARSLTALVGDDTFRNDSCKFNANAVALTDWKTVASCAVEAML